MFLSIYCSGRFVLSHTLTSEALATLAGEAIKLVNACASILAGTRQTVVPVQVAVLSHPSRLTVTAVTGCRPDSDNGVMHKLKLAENFR